MEIIVDDFYKNSFFDMCDRNNEDPKERMIHLLKRHHARILLFIGVNEKVSSKLINKGREEADFWKSVEEDISGGVKLAFNAFLEIATDIESFHFGSTKSKGNLLFKEAKNLIKNYNSLNARVIAGWGQALSFSVESDIQDENFTYHINSFFSCCSRI